MLSSSPATSATRQAVRLGQRGVVGQRRAGEAPVRLQDPVVREALGRLRPEQARTVDGARDRAIVASLERVGHRQRRQHGGVRAADHAAPGRSAPCRAAAGRRRGSAPAPAGRRPGSRDRAVPIPGASRRPAPARAVAAPRPPRHRAPRRRRASPCAPHRCRDVGRSARDSGAAVACRRAADTAWADHPQSARHAPTPRPAPHTSAKPSPTASTAAQAP